MRQRTEQWAPGLMHDSVYEYTFTADCDGSDVKYLRRRPPITVAATGWEPATAERYLAAQAETICPACNGNGLVSNMDFSGRETTYDCPDCKGEGVRTSSSSVPGSDD